MAVVNGPIRHELGMNWGIGAMGPYNHANATIGRAWGLLSQNLQGGSTPGLTYLGSQGNNYAYNSITLRRERGAQPLGAVPRPARLQARRQRASALFGGCRLDRVHARPAREATGESTSATCCAASTRTTAPVFVLDPITARQFIDRGGFDTKEKLIDWVHENATMPAGEYWDYQLIQNYIYPRATFGEEPFASKLKAPPDELIPMFRARTRSTSSSSAARRTATGGSWAPATGTSPSTTGGSVRPRSRLALPSGRGERHRGDADA